MVSNGVGRYWLDGTLFGMEISARSEERIRFGMDRLADLIDPVEKHFADAGKMVDREALLALADEMDRWAHKCDYVDRNLVSPILVAKYAARIREACGEEP